MSVKVTPVLTVARATSLVLCATVAAFLTPLTLTAAPVALGGKDNLVNSTLMNVKAIHALLSKAVRIQVLPHRFQFLFTSAYKSVKQTGFTAMCRKHVFSIAVNAIALNLNHCLRQYSQTASAKC